MNPEPDPTGYDPVSSADRWIDAALSEHARLGRDSADEELILRILQETVHRPARSRSVPRASRDWSMAAAGLAAAAALVALVFLVLSTLPVETGERRSDELRFVVTIDATTQNAALATGSPRPVLAAKPHSAPMDVITPSTTPEGGLSLARVDLELISEFAPTFGGLPLTDVRREDVRITADRGTKSKSELVYEGDVLVEHKQFRIEADSVRVPVPGRSTEPEQSPLLAKRVRVIQSTSDCIAEAETLRFDPVNGSLILTGVTHVATVQGDLARFAPDDKLVLSSSGFSIERAVVEQDGVAPLLVR